MAKKMLGQFWAQLVAGTSIMLAPIALAIAGFYSMNAFDLLFWSLAAYQLMFIIERGTMKNWLLLGLILGLGLMNKISLLWWCTGLFLAVLLNKQLRSDLLKGPPIIAGVFALLLFSPHVIWQILNDLPTLEFMSNATNNKMRSIPLSEFFGEQFVLMNPLAIVLYLGGLLALLFNQDLKRYRPLGIIFLVVLAILLLNGTSRPNYLTPAYPPILAAGAVFLEKWLSSINRKWGIKLYAGLLGLLGIFALPMALPVLSVDTFIKYQEVMGMEAKSQENITLASLPQHFADRMGWPQIAEQISNAYLSLSPSEREDVKIYVNNYGEAGSLEYYSEQFPLPSVLSAHNNYWLWGKDEIEQVGSIIRIGDSNIERLESLFEEVRPLGQTSCEYCIPYENNLPIVYCKNPKFSWSEIWESEKSYN
jgi:hypothetical protein